MSEENTNEETQAAAETAAPAETPKLDGYFAFKLGMSSVYNDNGEAVPVTVLRYEPWVVSQIKTVEKDGYEAVQIACRPRKAKNAKSAESKRLKAAGFENGAQLIREIRMSLPEGLKVGDKVDVDTLQAGDTVKVTGRSKGRGFQGVIKRHGYGGGPAAHGSKFHRQPGSIGNRTWPGRVMPGKKLPGHFGDERKTVKNVKIVEVLPEENVLMVKGPVPGARNSMVRLLKV